MAIAAASIRCSTRCGRRWSATRPGFSATRALAEDCAQDALVKLFGRLDDYDRERDALTWALTHRDVGVPHRAPRACSGASETGRRRPAARSTAPRSLEHRELVRAALATLELAPARDREVIAASLTDDDELRTGRRARDVPQAPRARARADCAPPGGPAMARSERSPPRSRRLRARARRSPALRGLAIAVGLDRCSRSASTARPNARGWSPGVLARDARRARLARWRVAARCARRRDRGAAAAARPGVVFALSHGGHCPDCQMGRR